MFQRSCGAQVMTQLALSRCARPTLTRRSISTYTVLGFTGYAVASLMGSALAMVWELTLTERLIGLLAPPLAFLVVVTVASAIVGRERIVFYQTAFAGVISTAAVAAIAGVRVARLVDLATVGIGTFLVFGRIGCFAVACCHGTLGRGVVYGPDHVRLGFWARWDGRSLWPVQLVESAASGILVVLALAVGASVPGNTAVIYIVGYGALRFALELVRGDAARPHVRGVSEAQWLALISVIACAIWQPSPITIAAAVALAAATTILVACARHRELFQPLHLRELDGCCLEALGDPTHARRATSLGVDLSWHALPDGRIDWVLSSAHPAWSIQAAGRIARALWRDHEVIAGRSSSVVHVAVPNEAMAGVARRR
jgi:hypothetical protein